MGPLVAAYYGYVNRGYLFSADRLATAELESAEEFGRSVASTEGSGRCGNLASREAQTTATGEDP